MLTDNSESDIKSDIEADTGFYVSLFAATLSLRPDTSDNTNLAQCYTGINITTLTKHSSLTNAQIVLTVFVSRQAGSPKNVGLMWTKDKVAGYTYILVLAALQSQR